MNWKVLGVIAGLVLTTSLSACSGGSTDTPTQTDPNASPATENTTSGEDTTKSGDAVKKDDAKDSDATKKDDAKDSDATKKDDAKDSDATKTDDAKDSDATKTEDGKTKP